MLHFTASMTTASRPPVALAVVLDQWLPRLLREAGYRVLSTTSGADACILAAERGPDVVIVDPILEDMSGTDACRLIRADPAIPRQLPVLILVNGTPTPELRVAALRVGAWDFVTREMAPRDVVLKLATYLEARRAFADGIDGGFIDPASGFCTRSGLARRTRELVALMTRVGAGLACAVVEVDSHADASGLGVIVDHATRVSDVVGDLGSGRVAIVAPATDARGAVRLAERVGHLVTMAVSRTVLPETPEALGLAVGYDAIANLRHTPVDPYAILHRAISAVRDGEPDAGFPWVRRFDESLQRIRRHEANAARDAGSTLPPVGHGERT